VCMWEIGEDDTIFLYTMKLVPPEDLESIVHCFNMPYPKILLTMLISKSNCLQPMQLLLTTTTRLFDKRINSIFHTIIHQNRIKPLGKSCFPTSFCRL
jgi:hypothetical protein